MKKRKRRASIMIWIALVTIIRVLYVFLNRNVVTDLYSYFEHATRKAGERELLLTSGLSFAYTNVLSKVASWSGNRIEAVMLFQVILQILALCLFLGGIWKIWGRLAAFLSATFLAVMPVTFQAIHNVEPTSYILFHFSVLLFLMGNFYIRARQDGWSRSSLCELYLMILGFYLGVVCTWNYTGFLLAALFCFILMKNRINTRELIWRQNRKLLEEKDQMMSTFSQGLIVFCGAVLGMFATLIKYTGISGDVITGQFKWWYRQYLELSGVCQGTELRYGILVAVAVFMGALCNMLQIRYQSSKEAKLLLKKIEQQQAMKEQTLQETPKVQEVQETQSVHELPKATVQSDPSYFITEDGRKVQYLDNPLPVPKKHVERHLDFDFDVNMDDIMDFDREMDEVEAWERKD